MTTILTESDVIGIEHESQRHPLGIAEEQLIREIGPADEVDDHRNDDESLFDDCYFHYKAEGFVAISDDNGVVHSIQVEENAILDSGISAASSMDEVIEHYGQGYERSESDFMFQPGILIITLSYPRSNGRLEFSFSEGRLTGKVTPRKLLLTTASNH